MRVFLTGGTGFVGGALARQLVEAGHDVRALVRRPDQADALRALGIELHAGDVTDPASMRDPMRGVDGVFHVAGWYKIGHRDSSPGRRVNVDGTRNVLTLMRDLRIPKGVYTSTLAVNSNTHGRLVDETYRYDGPYLTVYERTKAAAHRLAEDFIAAGLPLVIVQPALIYGPGDTSGVRTTLVRVLTRALPAIPRETAFGWSHVEDIARGHILAMERGAPGRSYFLAGPVHTLEEGLELAAELGGVAAPRRRVSPRLLRTVASLVAPIERLAPVPSALRSESLRTVAGVTYIGTSARATTELGWHPRSLREGLAETMNHEIRLLGAAAPARPATTG